MSVGVIIGIIVGVLILGGIIFFVMKSTSSGGATPNKSSKKVLRKMTERGGVEISVLREGKGPEIKRNQIAKVHYVGRLTNGQEFDSSRKRTMPFEFKIGAGKVIEGWDVGVVGMKKGELRELVVPAAMAYGNKSVGGVIPANSTLIFEVELMGIGV